MRIGTWNLEGRWDARHLDMVESMRCDVLLLTEVSERVKIPGMVGHAGEHRMSAGRRWSAVFSNRPMRALVDPHGASSMVEVDAVTFCATVLPWRGCGERYPWRGASTAERTVNALADIECTKPRVWGGDWNHALRGREWSGSLAGRAELLATLDRLDLQVPTEKCPHRIDGLLSIDHIAVPSGWEIRAVDRYVASIDEQRISDHDAYAVDVSGPEAPR